MISSVVYTLIPLVLIADLNFCISLIITDSPSKKVPAVCESVYVLLLLDSINPVAPLAIPLTSDPSGTSPEEYVFANVSLVYV